IAGEAVPRSAVEANRPAPEVLQGVRKGSRFHRRGQAGSGGTARQFTHRRAGGGRAALDREDRDTLGTASNGSRPARYEKKDRPVHVGRSPMDVRLKSHSLERAAV